MKQTLIALLCLSLLLLTGCSKAASKAAVTPSAAVKPAATPKVTETPNPSLNPDPIPTAVIPPVNTPDVSPSAEVTAAEPLREVFTSGSRYTVREGDCLWSISARVLGSGSDWQRLWERNSDFLESPSLVYPGQILIIP